MAKLVAWGVVPKTHIIPLEDAMRGHLNVHGRWGDVLEIILGSSKVHAEICNGGYVEMLKKLVKNKELAEVVCDNLLYSFWRLSSAMKGKIELVKLMIGNERMADRIYGYIMDYPTILNDIARKNAESAEEISRSFIVSGYWLCLDENELGGITVRLPGGNRGFEEIRDKYSLDESVVLSFGGLRAEAGKGKLDGLVGDLIKRLCECDSMKLLQRLLCNLPEPRVLLGRLSVHGTLDELVKRILQESAEDEIDFLPWWRLCVVQCRIW